MKKMLTPAEIKYIKEILESYMMFSDIYSTFGSELFYTKKDWEMINELIEMEM